MDMQDLIAQIAATMQSPTTGPLPRRTKIYLKDDRPEINGRPMEVFRADAKEWIRNGLASATPFNEAAKGEPVQPSEYRRPVTAPSGPPTLTWNPNAGRWDFTQPEAALAPAVPMAAPSESGRAAAAPPVEGRAAEEPPAQPADTLDELRATWQAQNPDRKAPPAAKEAWFQKRIAEE